MEYKILINSKGVPVLVEVPKKTDRISCSLKNDYYCHFHDPTERGTCRCDQIYNSALKAALADESKHIPFKDEPTAILKELFLLVDFAPPETLKYELKNRIGQTFDLTNTVILSFEDAGECGQPCEYFADVCQYQGCSWMNKKLAILTPKENSAHSFTEGADVPESVPSCGDGWISVNDRLPDEEHDYIVFVDGEQPFVAHFFLYPVDGSNWICYGHAVFPTHWQPLPKAPTKH